MFNNRCRLDRTSEFLIYGEGQQRRAVVEAFRLSENKRDKHNLDSCETAMPSDDKRIQDFKERSQKWQKLVTQVKYKGFLSLMFNYPENLKQ